MKLFNHGTHIAPPVLPVALPPAARLRQHGRRVSILRLISSLGLAASALSAAEIRIAPPADPAGDATPIIAEAVERAIASGASRLVLVPGVYQIHPHQARERFAWVSNHDDGLRRTPFPVWGAKNLEINGSGALLVMRGLRMVPIMIYDSENVTIRNLRIDWNRALHAQGTIVAVNPGDDSFEAEFLPECNARMLDGQLVHGMGEGLNRAKAPWQLQPAVGWRQNLQWTHWIDAETGAPLPHPQQMPLHAFSSWNPRLQRAAEVEQVGPNRFRFRHALPTLPAVGTAFAAKGMLMPNRTSPAIHIAGSRDVTVEDVVVHHAGGMGLIAENTENIVLRRYQVRLPENSSRLVTTTADGSHFSQCSGRILVEDCLFENMLDDAINVHGVHAIVDAAPADDRVGIRLRHFQQLGLDYVRPGERIRFCSRETLLPYAERTVKSVRRISEVYYDVTFTEPVRAVLRPDSIVDNASRQPDFVFRGNTVRRNRGRGVLATTGGRVVVEDNLFERPGGGGMGVTILLEGDAAVWHESGAVEDVTIRRNTFVTLNPRSAAIVVAPRQPGVTDVQPPYHRNIRIEGNTFRVAGPILLEANRVAGLRFANNTVAAANPGAAMPREPSFVLRASEDVAIIENRIDLPAPASIEQVTPTAGLVVRENTGLAEN